METLYENKESEATKVDFTNVYLIDSCYIIANTIKEAIDVYNLKYPLEIIKSIKLVNTGTFAYIKSYESKD